MEAESGGEATPAPAPTKTSEIPAETAPAPAATPAE